MIFKNRSLCRKCLFGFPCGIDYFCEYQLVTGEKRQNTATECMSFIKKNKTYKSVESKIEAYKAIKEK